MYIHMHTYFHVKSQLDKILPLWQNLASKNLNLTDSFWISHINFKTHVK